MNFNQADKQVWAAIQRLNAPEMHPLLTFLKNQAEHSKTSLIRADGPDLGRLQGRAGYLEDLLEAVEQATSVLEKLP
jgi:hypothetical protein